MTRIGGQRVKCHRLTSSGKEPVCSWGPEVQQAVLKGVTLVSPRDALPSFLSLLHRGTKLPCPMSEPKAAHQTLAALLPGNKVNPKFLCGMGAPCQGPKAGLSHLCISTLNVGTGTEESASEPQAAAPPSARSSCADCVTGQA